MSALAVNPFDEVDRLIDQYEDIPASMYLFEAADPALARKEAANAEIEEKTVSLIQKIINGIKAFCKAIKERIKNLLDYFKASSEEKMDFETFCKEMQNDPDMKGKKVTFHDYREICAEMDRSCSEFEKEYTKFKQSQAEDNPNLMKTIQNKLEQFGIKSKEVMQAEGSSFALEVALTWAKNSREGAAAVQKFLDFDLGLLAVIERELGSKEVRKFKKKIRKLNSSSKILRLLVGGRSKQVSTLDAAFKDVCGSLRSLWSVHRRAKKGKHKAEVKSAEKALIKTGIGVVKATHEGNVKARQKARTMERKAKRKELLAEEKKAQLAQYD